MEYFKTFDSERAEAYLKYLRHFFLRNKSQTSLNRIPHLISVGKRSCLDIYVDLSKSKFSLTCPAHFGLVRLDHYKPFESFANTSLNKTSIYSNRFELKTFNSIHMNVQSSKVYF